MTMMKAAAVGRDGWLLPPERSFCCCGKQVPTTETFVKFKSRKLRAFGSSSEPVQQNRHHGTLPVRKGKNVPSTAARIEQRLHAGALAGWELSGRFPPLEIFRAKSVG